VIITQAPLRISFLGGGTDFPHWYAEHGGAGGSPVSFRLCSCATGPWVSVTERLPTHDEKVLVWHKGCPRLAYYSEPDEFRPSGWVSDGEGFDLTDVTHWAEPLPPR